VQSQETNLLEEGRLGDKATCKGGTTSREVSQSLQKYSHLNYIFQMWIFLPNNPLLHQPILSHFKAWFLFGTNFSLSVGNHCFIVGAWFMVVGGGT
jgi:hypothetical protein